VSVESRKFEWKRIEIMCLTVGFSNDVAKGDRFPSKQASKDPTTIGIPRRSKIILPKVDLLTRGKQILATQVSFIFFI